MKRLQTIKEQLIAQVETQMEHPSCVDTEELGQVIDMIKDLAKAIYYCEVYEQMEEADKSRKSASFNWGSGTGTFTASRHIGGEYTSSNNSEGNHELHLRDEREGRSPLKRKMYMEDKMNGHDLSKTSKELESYMQDLTTDMVELLEYVSPEEKSIIQKKMNTLAAKIQNM